MLHKFVTNKNYSYKTGLFPQPCDNCFYGCKISNVPFGANADIYCTFRDMAIPANAHSERPAHWLIHSGKAQNGLLTVDKHTLYDSIKGHMNPAKQLVMGIGMRSMAGSEMFKYISQVRQDHFIFSTSMHHSRNWKLF